MPSAEKENILPLPDVYERQVLPLFDRSVPPRLLVALPTLKEFLKINSPLPEGVATTPVQLRSKRLRVRRNRVRSEYMPVVAKWPQDRLIAMRMPVLVCAVSGDVDMRFADYMLRLPQGQMCLLPPEVPRTDGTEGHVLAPG